MITSSRFLPNITGIVRSQYWNTPHINKDLYKSFEEEQVESFKRNKNLKELIGSTHIEKGKVKKLDNTNIKGKCSS